MKVSFAIGAIICYVLYLLTCQRNCPIKWNQICIGEHMIHIHHWIIHISCILLLSCIPKLRDNSFVLGFIVGGIIHGFTYGDWYVVYKKCKK